MYLKSIEVQGFKSFANKIVFDFHNGITGIVGPNGSGKSNVSDAVRWVLGEQSAKQLRGASMQDVIFAGTENRKPLSYAYVAITMDNSDHKLAIDFEEVTVSRRVYRSGESEYLINGNPCRLKDVTELFYDTGIGKEGYSIIGQGQIERILNGKPEERRELFDEAAGIVKYKKRKATAQKKLENERENLVRVNDILAELERQVGPLEKQAEKARIYLKKKEELKTYDVNMFLLEVERIEGQLKEVQEKYGIADGQLKDASESYDNIKTEYEKLEQDIEVMEEKITEIRENISNSTVMKGRLENQISVLKEQIHSAELTDEHMQSRIGAIDREKEERIRSRATYQAEKETLDGQLAEIDTRKLAAEEELSAIQKELARCREGIDKGKNELMELLSQNASIKARQQRCDTMAEQINIRKAQLTKRLLARKSEEADLETVLKDYEEELATVNAAIEEGKAKAAEMEESLREWKRKSAETSQKLEEDLAQFHKDESRLESLKNIAERYDGYGNSIRRVMEQKAKHPGLLGVVSDLIQVDKKYETAIETALGGNIQNIVTEDEETAKEMIAFLKQNRFGRATFLPLTSVNGKGNFKNPDALKEKGVIGLANTLVKTEARYEGVTAYLLGRVIVTEKIDDAIALAKKYHYSLHIVTLEGEYLSPGGSMTGGAFKNSSNLLARNREIEELERSVSELKKQVKEHKDRLEDIKTARDLLSDDLEEEKRKLQEQYILQNTAKLNVERATEQRNESESVYAGLQNESREIEQELLELSEQKEQIAKEIADTKERETQIGQESETFQKTLDEQSGKEDAASKIVSGIQMEEASIKQKAEFVRMNMERIDGEITRYEKEREQVFAEAEEAKTDAEKKRHDIEEIQKTILASDDTYSGLEEELKTHIAKKEEMSAAHKGFFEKREEVANQISNLDKEIFRLNSQREKLEEAQEYQNNYMWEEYELTLHAAMELRDTSYEDLAALKKLITALKDEIRKLGDVNVNAIEDYKEVSERYTFLKTQHDDLVEAEKTLVGIIEELDTGMRKQFLEKFAEIQQEFDKVFKELFGGGKGSLELVEDEDILECGIRIIAQPPGKKLQNMMQMSGGEKSLTAIALLFAIQNLKPSPFCLLDEIEAALDDSNVSRFAKYLHKLTKNTQFIVITHRRGTMAAADRLYGITMQEKGVSTLVSVNLIENDLEK
uniref:chromosome segregation protein SMC n=1 Tax=Roseburia sp. TaxID=2049040 RepID=UPI003FEDF41E